MTAPQTPADVLRRVASEHGVQLTVPDVHDGPSVAAYGIVPAAGVAPAKVATLAPAWSLALGRPVRYVGAVGDRLVVEVPKDDRRDVPLSQVLNAPAAGSYELLVPVGVKTSGGVLNVTLDALPHMLVAGATGSGKSVYVNAVLTSLLRQAGPDRLALLMIDPKRVELLPYARLPHLMAPIATEMGTQALDVLQLAVEEMERRYELMAAAGVRHVRDLPAPPPRLVVMIDELSDLIQSAGKQAVELLTFLAQKARAAGVHLIMATQRPSADIVPGKIKTNVPTRIAFALPTMTDSRVVLDANGAELLTGRGDGLVALAGRMGLMRFQAPYVTDDEVAIAVASHIAPPAVAEIRDGAGKVLRVDVVDDRADERDEEIARLRAELAAARARETLAQAPAPTPAPRCEHDIHDILAAELTERTRRGAFELDERMTALTNAVAAMAEVMAAAGLRLPDEVKRVIA